MDVLIVADIPLFPSMSPVPPTIPINITINDTPAISNIVFIVNNAMIDNMSVANECEDKEEIEEVNDFESLEIDFHNANKTNMFSPSSKNPKLLTLMTHLQSRRDKTNQEKKTLCYADLSLIYQKILFKVWKRSWKYFGHTCLSYLVS